MIFDRLHLAIRQRYSPHRIYQAFLLLVAILIVDQLGELKKICGILDFFHARLKQVVN